jgi:hypothetical protein
MLQDYRKQHSIFTEVKHLAEARKADSHLMASVMLEAEHSTAYGYYIDRSMDCEALVTFCNQKLRSRNG